MHCLYVFKLKTALDGGYTDPAVTLLPAAILAFFVNNACIV